MMDLLAVGTPRSTGTRRRGALVVALAALVTAGCERDPDTTRAAVAAEPAPVHVDSVFPIEEELRRFRAGLPEVTALDGAAASRDALVAQFLDALARRDANALRALALTPAEFAWLYYPHTHFTSRPYEMAPGLVWFQLENYGSRGLNRALSRHGGESFDGSYSCGDEPRAEGPNTIHAGCVVHRVLPSGEPAGVSLFGPILERDGRFKFISLANTL